MFDKRILTFGLFIQIIILITNKYNTTHINKGCKLSTNTTELKPNTIPEGFRKIKTLRGHGAHIFKICWSPNGKMLASCSGDWTVKLWDGKSLEEVGVLEGHNQPVTSVSWCPTSKRIATGSKEPKFILSDIDSKKTIFEIDLKRYAPYKHVNTISWSPISNQIAFSIGDHRIFIYSEIDNSINTFGDISSGNILCVEWSPDGSLLAACTDRRSIYVWDISTQQINYILNGHFGSVNDIAWCHKNNLLASASSDETIRIWNPLNGRLVSIIEGHTNAVNGVCFSPNGDFLASKSDDNTVRIWRVNKWDVTVIIPEPLDMPVGGISFHPQKNIFTTIGIQGHGINIWKYNATSLNQAEIIADSRHYVNARVVLTGDTGVGKSGLSLLLTGKKFMPTESTHSRHVWTFDSWEVILPNRNQEEREILLWDLAGQPGYRLIHQLHLSEVTVALVLFDARSEVDPLAGVRHWDRALKQAHRISGTNIPLKKILVSARSDRGVVSLSKKRIEDIAYRMGFNSYIETSAKENIGITKLIKLIKDAIDWDILPKVSSNVLFLAIKQFLINEKESNRIISTQNNLYHAYLACNNKKQLLDNEQKEFETCIRLVEARGLLRKFKFGNLILLKSELLDAYASALIEAAKNEPDGLGCIKEEDAISGEFFIPSEIKIKNKEEEKLLCLATIEDLLRHELALRQDSDSGSILVFPSQLTRNWDQAPNPKGEAVIFHFEGPVYNIYARLAVRLVYSGIFNIRQMWQNACTFSCLSLEGEYGIFLKEVEEGLGKISIFYNEDATEDMQSQFEAYIFAHLRRHSLPDSIKKEILINCDKCGDPIPSNSIRKRIEKSINWISCPTCDNKLDLLLPDKGKSIREANKVLIMDNAADKMIENAAAVSIIDGKIATSDYDVFLCYNSKDRSHAEKIAKMLKERGILPWLDIWELQPGKPWQNALEDIINSVKSAAVLIGNQPLTLDQKRELSYIQIEIKNRKERQYAYERLMDKFKKLNLAIGPWQSLEIEACLRQFIKRDCPVIPVILSEVEGDPQFPLFLEGMSVVDFRTNNSNPLERLIWGITGSKAKLFEE